MPKLEAIRLASTIKLANSKDSLKAAARRGCRVLSTGSSGRAKSAGNFSQVMGGKVSEMRGANGIVI
jgi:hypothetical protein